MDRLKITYNSVYNKYTYYKNIIETPVVYNNKVGEVTPLAYKSYIDEENTGNEFILNTFL